MSVSWKTAIAIKKNNDVALVAWDIEAGQILLVSYNETDNVFELLSETANILVNAVESLWVFTFNTSKSLALTINGISYNVALIAD